MHPGGDIGRSRMICAMADRSGGRGEKAIYHAIR
jgi:hypothetical protein